MTLRPGHLLSLAAFFFAACSEPEPKEVETVVLCVWDSVDVDFLWDSVDAELEKLERGQEGEPFPLPPSLERYARSPSATGRPCPRTRSSSAALASILTRSSVQEHGLRSVRELGAQRISSSVTTLAEELKGKGYTTLASVSEAHFEISGLNRGFDAWHAPARREPRSWRTAAEVLEAAEAAFDAALESGEPVFLFLHFGDLRGNRWRDVEPPRELLEAHLKEWIDDEVVREAFEAEDDGPSLASRLRRALLRRTGDPRREALVRAHYAAALDVLDDQVGTVIDLLRKHGRAERATVAVGGGSAGSTLEGGDPGPRRRVPKMVKGDELLIRPCYPSVSSGADVASWPYGIFGLRAAQGVAVECVDSTFAGLRAHLISDDAGVVAWEDELVRETSPGPQRLQSKLEPGGRARLRFQRRGAAFSLRLKHEQLFQLGPQDVVLGSTTLARSDLPEIVPSTSPDWPENALVGPLLDLQQAGMRRLRGRVEATAGARVEVLIEVFPADLELVEGIECPDGEVTRHPLRPGAAWIRGQAPLEFVLPPRSPAHELGVLLRVDGERISGSRMRYLKRVLAAPDTLELGFSAGAWLDGDLRATDGESPPGRIRIDLLDELPLREAPELPSPAELRYLRGLDEDE